MSSPQEVYHSTLSNAFVRNFIKDFDPEEFAPSRRIMPPGHRTLMILPTVIVLQKMRDAGCGPITITSAWRDPQYNESVGGAPNSQHIYFTAADVVARDWTPAEVFEWLDDQPFRSLLALGRYRTFTHIDTRHWKGNPQEGEGPARWDNR